MPNPERRSRRTRWAAWPALLIVLAAGCGTRLSDDEVVSAARAGIDPSAVTGPVTAPGATSPSAPQAVDSSVGTPGVSAVSTAVPGSLPSAQAPAADKASAPVAGKSGAPAPAKSSTCTTAGTPLVIGQVGTFSGVVGAALSPIEVAVKVWSAMVNSRGGVACHPVVLHTVDDGGDTGRTAAAVADLVENKKAVALVGLNLAVTSSGVVPYVQKHKIPVISGEQASFFWTQNSMFFPVGGTVEAMAVAAPKIALAAGQKKMGLLYCGEASACTNFNVLLRDQEYAKKGGADLVFTSQISLTQPSFTANCQSARSAGVENLYAAMDSPSIVRLARDCSALGWRPGYQTASVAANELLAPNPHFEGLTIGIQTFPWMATDTAAAREYHEAFKRYAPNTTLGAGGALAWAGGQMLAAALNKLGAAAQQPVTSEMILRGLYMIKNETLGGLVPPTTYTPDQARAKINTCYAIAKVTGGKWTTPNGSKFFC